MDLTAKLLAVEGPLVMGIDSNYATFPSDVHDPERWRDAEKRMPAIAECWYKTGLQDAFAVEDLS